LTPRKRLRLLKHHADAGPEEVYIYFWIQNILLIEQRLAFYSLVRVKIIDTVKHPSSRLTVDLCLPIILAIREMACPAFSRADWQRGSNENLNGLVRQFIPKSRPLSTVSDKELAMIQDRLNNRPRKRLGYKTPLEVFTHELHRVRFVRDPKPQ
jgi:hypothetical protein